MRDAAGARRGRARWIRAAFAGYALLLFLATHWPQPELGVPPIGNLDKLVHLVMFAMWGGLLTASGLFGPALSRRNLSWSLAAGLVYGAVDEGLQMIPWLHRSAEWADYGANAAGVVVAAGVAAAMAKSRVDKA